MRLHTINVIHISAAALLMSCGGSETVILTVPTSENGNTTFAQAMALLDTHADPVTYTDLTTIPTLGSANFLGLTYGDLANTNDSVTDTLIGELSVDADFGASFTTFSGQIDNLTDENGDTLSGTLELGNANFDRSSSSTSDPTIGIAVFGNITDGNGEIMNINARLEGDFLGSEYNAVGGEFLGSVTVSSQQQNLDGGFIAER